MKMKESYSDITILVDIDDTIEELLPAWCKWLNDKYILSVKPESITDWEIAKFFPTLTEEQVFEPLHTESFWYTVEPKKDAAKYLKMLIEKGFNVFLCTSTDYRNIKPKYEAIILRYFPFIHWSKVIVSYKKQMIKADFLIDDGVQNQKGGDYIKILVSAPHNQAYNAEQNGMIRADNWSFIYDKIIEISNDMINSLGQEG